MQPNIAVTTETLLALYLLKCPSVNTMRVLGLRHVRQSAAGLAFNAANLKSDGYDYLVGAIDGPTDKRVLDAVSRGRKIVDDFNASQGAWVKSLRASGALSIEYKSR